MLVYFLGGKSESSDEFFAYATNKQSDFRYFKKIGTFAEALKLQRPGLIVAEQGFLGGDFNLNGFLSEQNVCVPLIIMVGERQDNVDLLFKLKDECKISDKLFELLKFLYASQKTQTISEIRERLLAFGIKWSQNCIRVSLCRLKKILKSQKKYKVGLVKERKGYRLLLPDQFVKLGI